MKTFLCNCTKLLNFLLLASCILAGKPLAQTFVKFLKYSLITLLTNKLTLMISCPRTPPTMADTGPNSAKQWLKKQKKDIKFLKCTIFRHKK